MKNRARTIVSAAAALACGLTTALVLLQGVAPDPGGNPSESDDNTGSVRITQPDTV